MLRKNAPGITLYKLRGTDNNALWRQRSSTCNYPICAGDTVGTKKPTQKTKNKKNKKKHEKPHLKWFLSLFFDFSL